MKDDLELAIDSTWMQTHDLGFDRVVIVEYFTRDVLSSDPTNTRKSVGDRLRRRIMNKLDEELSFTHQDQYIFGAYDFPAMDDGKWVNAPKYESLKTKILFRNEEDFVIFKLHYGN